MSLINTYSCKTSSGIIFLFFGWPESESLGTITVSASDDG
jgi:hypothetical protein